MEPVPQQPLDLQHWQTEKNMDFDPILHSVIDRSQSSEFQTIRRASVPFDKLLVAMNDLLRGSGKSRRLREEYPIDLQIGLASGYIPSKIIGAAPHIWAARYPLTSKSILLTSLNQEEKSSIITR